MDFSDSLAGAQGPLFWGAAAAAALGASFLVTALVLHLRRVRPAVPGGRKRRPRPAVRFSLLRKPKPAPGPAVAVPGGYAPARPALARAAGTEAPPAPDLEPLLARLRRAGDRLAAIQAEAGDSRLKATPPRTDQMYRRGVG